MVVYCVTLVAGIVVIAAGISDLLRGSTEVGTKRGNLGKLWTTVICACAFNHEYLLNFPQSGHLVVESTQSRQTIEKLVE